jgi:hypothetical protein
MQDTALGNEAAALRLRARAVAKEIAARKQVAAARESLAAQELQLQNMTMGDTRTSASIAPVDPMTSTSARTVDTVPELNALAAMFPSVSRRYLDDIFYGRLDVKNIMRFTADLSSAAATDAADPPDARSLLDLLRAFDIYAFIALSFVPHLTVRWELHRGITLYRQRIMGMAGYKTFASIRLYHQEFVTRAIRMGQDNPLYWTSSYPEAEWKLTDAPKRQFDPPSSSVSSRRPYLASSAKDALTPASGGPFTITNGACRQWAKYGECSNGGNCKYKHICISCQETHNPNRCPNKA